MRLLHIADVHLQRSFLSLGLERGRRRRAELTASLRGVVELARERRVDALCIAGDLFERENAGPAVGETLRATFAGLGDIPVVIAPGNHDYFTPGCRYDAVSWSSNVHVFRTPALTPLPINDGTIWGCAFVGPYRYDSPLAGFKAPDDSLRVALVHADVIGPGAPSNYGPVDPAEISASGFNLAMLGHIHAGRVAESARFAYPGSLEPLDPSETGPRWALLIDACNGGLNVDRIPVAKRQALNADLDVSDISTITDLQRWIDERRTAWDHADVRLRVTGVFKGELEDPDAIRLAFSDLSVTLEILARPEEDYAGLALQRTTLGAFVRTAQKKQDEAGDDATRQKWADVLRLGVAAFRGQDVTLQ
jgi:DNA repair exonuclease SbcCD nuclease subunit